eukprot:TRINITY_DN1385_c0_g1_i1.p2 TRINITY_DN1385_c0_g1~~TRINITY_DN1385_c0_g1_i1.p2  ORF type:complete len:711 (-),score=125.71 TRINITY_DN1385_c0_g1_i1:2148-4085(-)
MDQQGSWGRTPLHWAAIAGHVDVVSILGTEGGASTLIADETQMIPLHLAVLGNHVNVVKELLLRGNALKMKTAHDRWGNTPLQYLGSNAEMSSFLNPSGEPILPPNIRILDIFDACEQGDIGSLQALLQKHGDKFSRLVNTRGAGHRNPLHYACLSGQTQIVEVLLRHQAQPDDQDDHGWTSLHWAANNNHYEIVRLLLQNGANKTMSNKEGKIPAELAKKSSIKHMLEATNVELYDWLKSHGLESCSKDLGTEEITLTILPTLSDVDLKDLGIKLGTKKKLMQAISELVCRGLTNSDPGFPGNSPNSGSSGNSRNSGMSNSRNSSFSGEYGNVDPRRSSMDSLGSPEFPPMEDRSGDQLYLKDIQIKSLIGSGAFGSVYRGIWDGTTEVALKQLHLGEPPDQFESEARILRCMRHPNVVSFLGLYQDDQAKFIVTEFLADGGLDMLLRSSDMSSQQQIQIAMETVAGMSYLSSHHIVHRDLAARNLLCVKRGSSFSVKVADFGMSRMMSEDYYRTSKRLFPIKWTAPESIKFLKFSPASDVWSFGIVLWEILSRGEVPYAGMENRDCVERIQEGYRLPQPELCTDAVYDIMMSCWQTEPHLRPQWKELFIRLKSTLSPEDADPRRDVRPSDSREDAQYLEKLYD